MQGIPDGGDDARGEDPVVQQVDAHQEVATCGDVGAQDEVTWPLADDLMRTSERCCVMNDEWMD